MDLSGIFSGTQNFVILATTVPFVIIAIVLLWIAINRQRKARSAARNWSMTMGQVIASGAQSYRSRSGNSGGYHTMYRPYVSYTYNVGGRTYASDRMAMGMSLGYGSSSVAEQKAARYPAGATVQVYYNPDNPAEATLETRSQGSGILVFVVIIIVVILAVSLAFTLGIGGFLGGFLSNLPK